MVADVIREKRPHPHLRVLHQDDVLTITLDNPGRHNAQTPSLWTALATLAKTLPSDVRVVVLRGAGPSFSAGLDRALLEPAGLPDEPNVLELAAAGKSKQVTTLIAACQRGFSAWRDCPAVVVAAVQGHAIGAGFQLALAADLRIVADDVGMVIYEPQLGMIPDLGGTSPLVRLLGYSAALELCLTGRAIDAREAVASKLAVLSVPPDQLQAATDDLVAAILQAPADAVRELKPLLLNATEASYSDQLTAERQAQTRLLGGLAAAANRRNSPHG